MKFPSDGSFVYFHIFGIVVGLTVHLNVAGQNKSKLNYSAGYCESFVEHQVNSTIAIKESLAGLNSSLTDTWLQAYRSPAIVGTGTSSRKESIFYFGLISERSVEQFERIVSEQKNIISLIINSTGGDEAAAIKMANIIRTRRLRIEVLAQCLSACANYIIGSSHDVTLNGVVALHGSPAGCLNRFGNILFIWKFGLTAYQMIVAAKDREEVFYEQYPSLKKLIKISSDPARGDPSNARHDWMLVRPVEMSKAGLHVTIGSHYEAYEELHFAISKLLPKLVGSVYIYDSYHPSW